MPDEKVKELREKIDSLSTMIHYRRPKYVIRQVIPFLSLPNSFIVAGEWVVPSREAQDEFAEAVKVTPSMQTDQYELHTSDDESDSENVDPQKGVKASLYGTLRETGLESMPIVDGLGFVAIWKLSSSRIFECLHSFNLPNLLMAKIEDYIFRLQYEVVYSGLQGQNFLFNEVPRGDEDEGKDV